MTADALAAEALRRLGLPPQHRNTLFLRAPLDFPVHLVRWLPFGVHRFGMAGITLFGRVWLLDGPATADPRSLIVLLRHEAEHVAQQRREPVLFYARYAFEWVAGRLHGAGWQEAYRGITFEKEAYAAGAQARRALTEP